MLIVLYRVLCLRVSKLFIVQRTLDTLTSFTLLPGYCLSARFLPLARLVAGNMKIEKREDKREEKNKLLLVKKRKSP